VNAASRPPGEAQANFSLARLTTVRTGGAAQWYARPRSQGEVVDLLAWAERAGQPVAVIGSGSNMLIADDGVPGLVLKLAGALARIDEPQGELILCGGGARLPSLAAKAAAAGMSGIEFAVNIPGTVGGAIRMNANAYGGQLAEVLQSAQIATPAGVQERAPGELGFAYRDSNLAPSEVVLGASFMLGRSQPARVKAALARMRARRHEAQPSGIRTFGSTFKNPPAASGPLAGDGRTAGQLLAAAGCAGLLVGGARFSLKHANFVENMGTATTADVIALMALGRSRVLEHTGVALEPEVRTLGAVRFPWLDGP
jgi:UDP-N-acetylmuramate dehydrogenase